MAKLRHETLNDTNFFVWWWCSSELQREGGDGAVL